MKVVVDTNVIAYYILGTKPYCNECSVFFHTTTDLLAPSSWQAELTNVLWLSVMHGVFDAAEGIECLRLANSLGICSIAPAAIWQGALARAVTYKHPAYDTLFIELAVREGCKLATFDQRLIELFPAIACRPHELNEK
ncbi:MAG: type II toxin-antitoxin system VapC family toxin [Deltaproteobacteria bacterium]|nr:type II toxin-antitoxin system VapC family toxin [Deltaproteobacteria bacterium]